MGDVTHLLTAEIKFLPGLDERGWAKFATVARQIVAKCGLGDAAADVILADVQARVLRAAPFSTDLVPREYERIVSKAYCDLLCEMVLLATEKYVARNYPPLGNENANL